MDKLAPLARSNTSLASQESNHGPKLHRYGTGTVDHLKHLVALPFAVLLVGGYRTVGTYRTVLFKRLRTG